MKTSLIFLLGLGMGTVLGLLTAPDAGRVTRKRIREEADRLIDKAIAEKKGKEEEPPAHEVVVQKQHVNP